MHHRELFDTNIVVTGGNGFLGKHLRKELTKYSDYVTVFDGDLTNQNETWDFFLKMKEPVDYLFHLAGYNGGIMMNRDSPYEIFYRNSQMALNIVEICRVMKIKKMVGAVTSCSYPQYVPFDGRMCEMGFCEEYDFFDGQPNPTVACHGYAKRNLQLACRFVGEQYGTKAVCVCPTTLYGPGDSFDAGKTKVVGGMVKRFVDAVADGAESVTCWGSGEPTRELLYVKDCAKMLVEAMLLYDDGETPLNLGSGRETSVRDLAETVAKLCGYGGEILWDKSKPDGQMAKNLSSAKAESLGSACGRTPLEIGLAETVEFYRSQKKEKS